MDASTDIDTRMDLPDRMAGSVGLVRTQSVRLFEPPDLLQLECGQKFGPIEVAYETYGTLNERRDNAILICHALTGDAHVAGWHSPNDRKPGWWDEMVGPGKGIDTNQYFVICSNILGGCKGTTGPSSINPATGRPWGLDFPVITIEDMVKVQKRLVEHLGIGRLLGVIGGSMGGMQVLEWAVRYPDAVRAIIPIATTARLNAQSIAFDAVGRNAILADPDFENGQYHDGPGPERGLAIARMVGHITYLSEAGMHAKFGRELRNSDKYSYDFGSEFSVETYLDHQGRVFVERFDANSYLYITKAMDYFDLEGRFGSLTKAFENVSADCLLISLSSDWLFTPKQSRQIVDAMLTNGKRVSYCEVNSPYGHDAFLLEPETLGRLIKGFFAAAAGTPRIATTEPVQPYRQPPARETVWTRQRADYDRIEALIEPNSRVLDLGCGHGVLMSRLARRKHAETLGVEVEQDSICECIDRGLRVVDLDLGTELTSFPSHSYDYVVLSQTLQILDRPDVVLREMLRIGHRAVLSFPNFMHWKALALFLTTGRMPVSSHLPFTWYHTPNRHYLTIRDFESFCRENRIHILHRTYLKSGPNRPVSLWPNIRAEEAIFVLTADPG